MLACDLQDMDIITSLVCLCIPTISGICVWNSSRVLKSLEAICQCRWGDIGTYLGAGGWVEMIVLGHISSEQWSLCKVPDSSPGRLTP